MEIVLLERSEHVSYAFLRLFFSPEGKIYGFIQR
jgi:hypothetical protein